VPAVAAPAAKMPAAHLKADTASLIGT